jgi:hypothetical protein
MRAKLGWAAAVISVAMGPGPTVARSPGAGVYGRLTIGPGSVTYVYDGIFQVFDWQINDAGPSTTFPNAPGVAGPQNNTIYQVSGWSQLQATVMYIEPPGFPPTTGDLAWTATSAPANKFQFALETLFGPTTTVGQSPDGPMSDFDPNLQYTWPFISYQGTYSGPTDSATLTASTLIDTSQFVNAIPATARFSIALDPVNKQMDLIYTPVPEPGTLGLVAVGALGVWRAVVRRSRP